jgi:methylisocitrate lyase
MVDRVTAVVDARTDPEFFVVARTDALAVEGEASALQRAAAYVAAGADALFLEAAQDLAQYARFAEALRVPILANITEFGLTPLWTIEELRAAGVAIALYPLSAFRAMNAAALSVYETLRREGTQRDLVAKMQSRADLYRYLDYERHERALDRYR